MEMAKAIPAKTLIIGGAHSHLNQQRVAELAHRIPHASFASLDLGHSPHEERPSEFLMAVEPFVAWFAK